MARILGVLLLFFLATQARSNRKLYLRTDSGTFVAPPQVHFTQTSTGIQLVFFAIRKRSNQYGSKSKHFITMRVPIQ